MQNLELAVKAVHVCVCVRVLSVHVVNLMSHPHGRPLPAPLVDITKKQHSTACQLIAAQHTVWM